MVKLEAIIKSLRPKHWIKNMFVFAALIFAAKFTDSKSIILAICTFCIFSFTASSIYLLNDVLDYEADRKHPIKRFRPIARGEVSRTVAMILSFLMGTGGIITSLIISPYLTLIIAAYIANNVFYSSGLKHVVILDVLMVSFGYVFRAVGGAVAISVRISPWFLVIIFLLTLFLAIMKRRQEFVEIAKNGGEKRKVLGEYNVEMLDQMANIIVPAVLVSYILFTFSTLADHTEKFIFTIPFVVYGIFRYLYLVHKKDLGENPTETLLSDLPLLLCVILWGLISVCLIYFYELKECVR